MERPFKRAHEPCFFHLCIKSHHVSLKPWGIQLFCSSITDTSNYAIWCNKCKTLLVSFASYLTIKLVNVEIKERQWKLFQLPFHSVKVQCITSPLAVISEIHHGPSLIGYIYVNNNLLRSTSSASSLWIMQNAMLNSDVAVSYFQ